MKVVFVKKGVKTTFYFAGSVLESHTVNCGYCLLTGFGVRLGFTSVRVLKVRRIKNHQ